MNPRRWGSRDAWVGGGGVLALHLLLTLIMTWPAASVAGSDLFGGPRGDKYQFLWNFWWARHALLDLHTSPLHTTLQYHPTGVSLALHDTTWLWTLLAVPLQTWLDPRTILNAILLVCLPLNGLAFHHLARNVTGDGRAALAGSVVYAYCPYLLGRFSVSHVQYLPAFLPPLFLLALWRYARDPRPARLAWAGLLLALQGLLSFYYAVVMAAALGALLGLRLATAMRDGRLRDAAPRLARDVAVCGLVSGALLLPVLAPMLRDVQRAAANPAPLVDDQNLETNSADLMGYFVPDHALAPWRGWDVGEGAKRLAAGWNASLHGNRSEKSVYVGWVAWLGLVVVLSSRDLRRRHRVWIALAAVAFTLSLGPTLRVQGVAWTSGWLPGGWSEGLPVLGVLRAPARFALFCVLGLAVVLSGALAALRERRGPRVQAVAIAACCVVSVLEFLPRPLLHHDRDRWLSAYYDTIRADPRPVAVLNVPADFHGSRGGGDLHLFAQTRHGKPIVGGYVSREPAAVFRPLEESAFLRAVLQRRYEDDPRLRLGDAGLADLDATLHRLEVGYVVVHRALLPGAEWVRVNEWLARGLGSAVHGDEWIRVYRTPASSARSARTNNAAAEAASRTASPSDGSQ